MCIVCTTECAILNTRVNGVLTVTAVQATVPFTPVRTRVGVREAGAEKVFALTDAEPLPSLVKGESSLEAHVRVPAVLAGAPVIAAATWAPVVTLEGLMVQVGAARICTQVGRHDMLRCFPHRKRIRPCQESCPPSHHSI